MEKIPEEKESRPITDVTSTPRDIANISRKADRELIAKIVSKRRGSWFSEKAKSDAGLPRGIYWGVAGLAVFFIASFIYVFYLATVDRASRSIEGDISRFQAGIESLKNLNFDSAEELFSSPGGDAGFTFQEVLAKFKPIFGTMGDIADSFRGLSSSGVGIAREIAFFQEEFFGAFLDGRGADIINHLTSTREVLATVVREADALIANTESFNGGSLEAARATYFPFKLDIAKFNGFLDALIPWLEGNAPRSASEGGEARPITHGRHVLVMFHNPSEIRPAGGFLGSYADVSIKNGALESVDVRDINDSDRELKQNIIPPQPLQAAVTRLRAADANWFFDFAKSAKLVTKLIEASELYSSRGFGFDGAISVSPKVIEDVLMLVGPVELEAAKFTFTAENFLEEVQRRVQVGQATRATYPKEILKDLWAEIFVRLRFLDGEKKGQIVRLAQAWIEKKDIMFYFDEPELQRFFESVGSAGTPYVPAANYEGDYLAIVDANVGGGKSDIYIKQDILLQSQINEDGTVANHLVVKREHQGNKSKYSWYKLPNEDYLQIFVPPKSKLANVRGGTAKTITPAANYTKNNYVNDPVVGALNSSTVKALNFPSVLRREESGREVWATWVKIKAGEKKEVVFDYTHRLFLEPRDGSPYRFVFEKQAGTKRHYTFEIAAPVGYHFLENDSPVYEYESDDPPGRLIINLTLRKI